VNPIFNRRVEIMTRPLAVLPHKHDRALGFLLTGIDDILTTKSHLGASFIDFAELLREHVPTGWRAFA
jgi:hypothetical protein